MSVTSVALRGKLFGEGKGRGWGWTRKVVCKGKVDWQAKGRKRHLLGERFNIVRIVNVKYNGRGKHPKNACSMLGTL